MKKNLKDKKSLNIAMLGHKRIPSREGGINQCYCAERDYSENELYIHQRDKMTHDINKLLSPEYKKRLLALF